MNCDPFHELPLAIFILAAIFYSFYCHAVITNFLAIDSRRGFTIALSLHFVSLSFLVYIFIYLL